MIEKYVFYAVPFPNELKGFNVHYYQEPGVLITVLYGKKGFIKLKIRNDSNQTKLL